MENIVPSDYRLNEESVYAILQEGNLDELLLERANLDKRKKEIDVLIEARKALLHETMTELGVDTITLGEGFFINNVKPFTRRKMMSVKQLQKNYPQYMDELVSEVNVGGYIQIKSSRSS